MMTIREQQRMESLEVRIAVLERAVGVAQRPEPRPEPPKPERPAMVTPPTPPPPPPPSPRTSRSTPHSVDSGTFDVRARPAINLEDLFGGRVLAWIGGIAVLVGLALFFALAVSNGWVGETARTLLAGAGAAALLSLGVWLRERKSQAEAALAAAGAGLAGLFMTITVAAEVYDLIPGLPAFTLAGIVGAAAMVLAVRWRSQVIAALGIVGSLLAPVMVGAPTTGTTIALLFTITAASGAVLVWQRWDWLGVATLVIATPQWVSWLFETDSVPAMVAALCAFGAAGILVAVGFELRLPFARLRASSSLLLAGNALVLAAAGYLALDVDAHTTLAQLWLGGLAALHLALGLAGSSSKRISHDLQLLVLTLGVLLSDVAFAAVVSGPMLAIGWACSSVVFATIARNRRHAPSDALLAQLGLGGHLALAIGHALVNDASPATTGGPVDVTGLLVTAAIAAACFTSARIASDRKDMRAALDLVGLAFVAYLTALAAEGPALVIAWAVEAVTLARIAQTRRDPVSLAGMAGLLTLAGAHVLAAEAPLDVVATGSPVSALDALALAAFGIAAFACARLTGAMSQEARTLLDGVAAVTGLYLAAATLDGAMFAGACGAAALVLAGVAGRIRSRALVLAAGAYALVALGHALAFEAPLESFLYGASDLPAAVVALVSAAAAPLVLARLGWLDGESRKVTAATGALTLLYAASVTVVSVVGSGGGEAVLDLDVRQQGQALVSALWGLVGVAALVAGLRRDVRELRVGALLLLFATAGKVFVFDLAALTSIYRVGSFVALGLLLLSGSFAYQRLRPRNLEAATRQ